METFIIYHRAAAETAFNPDDEVECASYEDFVKLVFSEYACAPGSSWFSFLTGERKDITKQVVSDLVDLLQSEVEELNEEDGQDLIAMYADFLDSHDISTDGFQDGMDFEPAYDLFTSADYGLTSGRAA